MTPDAFEQYAEERRPPEAEVDRLVARLERAPGRPPRPAARPRRTWWWVGGLAVAAALAMVLIWPRAPEGPRLRGGASRVTSPVAAGPVRVQLRVALQSGDGLVQVANGAHAAVGDRAFFQVWASGPTPVELRVEGPEGIATISRVELHDTEPVDVEDGRLSWRFERPGRYTFVASPGPGCGPGCARLAVEVR